MLIRSVTSSIQRVRPLGASFGRLLTFGIPQSTRGNLSIPPLLCTDLGEANNFVPARGPNPYHGLTSVALERRLQRRSERSPCSDRAGARRHRSLMAELEPHSPTGRSVVRRKPSMARYCGLRLKTAGDCCQSCARLATMRTKTAITSIENLKSGDYWR